MNDIENGTEEETQLTSNETPSTVEIQAALEAATNQVLDVDNNIVDSAGVEVISVDQPAGQFENLSPSDEGDDAILNTSMASGIGRRNRATPDHEADANRVAVAVDKVGRWLGLTSPEDTTGLIEVATVGKEKVLVRPSSLMVRSQTGAITVYNEGSQLEKPKLDRGGWTAVGLLIVFLPVVAFLGLLSFSLFQQKDALQTKLDETQKMADTQMAFKIDEAFNNPDTRQIHMKSLEGLPTPGQVTLLQPPLANWLLTYSRLQKLDNGKTYVIWFAKTHLVIPSQDESNYLALTSFSGTSAGSGNREITWAGVYKGGKVTDYTEAIVTIEDATQKDYKIPTAPIYFVAPLPANHL
jgi:hypothetical protein